MTATETTRIAQLTAYLANTDLTDYDSVNLVEMYLLASATPAQKLQIANELIERGVWS